MNINNDYNLKKYFTYFKIMQFFYLFIIIPLMLVTTISSLLLNLFIYLKINFDCCAYLFVYLMLFLSKTPFFFFFITKKKIKKKFLIMNYINKKKKVIIIFFFIIYNFHILNKKKKVNC